MSDWVIIIKTSGMADDGGAVTVSTSEADPVALVLVGAIKDRGSYFLVDQVGKRLDAGTPHGAAAVHLVMGPFPNTSGLRSANIVTNNLGWSLPKDRVVLAALVGDPALRQDVPMRITAQPASSAPASISPAPSAVGQTLRSGVPARSASLNDLPALGALVCREWRLAYLIE